MQNLYEMNEKRNNRNHKHFQNKNNAVRLVPIKSNAKQKSKTQSYFGQSFDGKEHWIGPFINIAARGCTRHSISWCGCCIFIMQTWCRACRQNQNEKCKEKLQFIRNFSTPTASYIKCESKACRTSNKFSTRSLDHSCISSNEYRPICTYLLMLYDATMRYWDGIYGVGCHACIGRSPLWFWWWICVDRYLTDEKQIDGKLSFVVILLRCLLVNN